MIVDVINDLFTKFYTFAFEQDEDKKVYMWHSHPLMGKSVVNVVSFKVFNIYIMPKSLFFGIWLKIRN